jgi:hypothetical protein
MVDTEVSGRLDRARGRAHRRLRGSVCELAVIRVQDRWRVPQSGPLTCEFSPRQDPTSEFSLSLETRLGEDSSLDRVGARSCDRAPTCVCGGFSAARPAPSPAGRVTTGNDRAAVSHPA